MRHPAHWIARPLAEVVDILDARRIPVKATDRVNLGGDVPYYGATGQAGTIDRAIFNEPLVLLGEDGAPFFDASKSKAYLVEGPAWVNNHAHVLRPRPGLDRRFLKYFLDVFDYRGFANGTTRLKLTQAAMRSIPVPIADSVEQGRIVEILEDHLSRLDAAHHGLRQASQRAENLHESAIRSLIPDDCPSRPLRGFLETPLTNGRSVRSRDGGFPVLRLTALKGAGVDLSERKAGDWSRAEASRFLVQRGDYLIARGNGSLRLVGRGSLVRAQPDEVAFPDTAIRARPRAETMLPEFLDMVWNSRRTRLQIEGVARTSAGIYKVNQSQLEGIELPLIPLEDQQRFVASIGAIDDHRRRLIAAISLAERRHTSLRRAVLAAAFEGKLTGRHTDAEMIEELTDV
ncbi:restriction endonuclease subunit S [Actinomycetota bacterium]